MKDQAQFWLRILKTTSNSTNTPISELQKFDVFDFFALVGVVEQQQKK